jgi:hypothetical protein
LLAKKDVQTRVRVTFYFSAGAKYSGKGKKQAGKPRNTLAQCRDNRNKGVSQWQDVYRTN